MLNLMEFKIFKVIFCKYVFFINVIRGIKYVIIVVLLLWFLKYNFILCYIYFY